MLWQTPVQQPYLDICGGYVCVRGAVMRVIRCAQLNYDCSPLVQVSSSSSAFRCVVLVCSVGHNISIEQKKVELVPWYKMSRYHIIAQKTIFSPTMETTRSALTSQLTNQLKWSQFKGSCHLFSLVTT